MSYGFRVKMIEYDEVARNLRQDSAKRVSEVSTSILFVAEHLRFSDDQVDLLYLYRFVQMYSHSLEIPSI